jgi:hypothetical protein
LSLLQPWILLRLMVGVTAVACFARAAATSLRLLRRFDVRRATEGQLALERQMELATTFVRAGAIVQTGAVAITVLAADRLSHSVRGAMCAYGVFQDNRAGFPALGVGAAAAFFAAVTSQLCAFDRRLRTTDLMRPIAVAAIVMAPLALADLVLTGGFLLKLDLGAVASCCSTQLDLGVAGNRGFASGSRDQAAWAAVVAVSFSVAVTWSVSARPRATAVVLAAALSLAAVPVALRVTVLEVAPHAFELPQHACPFCLLHSDVLWMGYPLFGSIFFAGVWSSGAAIAGISARGGAAAEAFSIFARQNLRRGASAWVAAALLAVIPILRHALVSGGRPLFP